MIGEEKESEMSDIDSVNTLGRTMRGIVLCGVNRAKLF